MYEKHSQVYGKKNILYIINYQKLILSMRMTENTLEFVGRPM